MVAQVTDVSVDMNGTTKFGQLSEDQIKKKKRKHSTKFALAG